MNFSKKHNWIILSILFLVIFDVFIWKEILSGAPNENPELYFLDVGQGDSELVVLPEGIKVLIDAGPNSKVLSQMDSIFSPFTWLSFPTLRRTILPA
jgi:beta-lactamase superfamily II metal-dependent hydrolase